MAKLQATESTNVTNVSYVNGGVSSSVIAAKLILSVVGIEVTAKLP